MIDFSKPMRVKRDNSQPVNELAPDYCRAYNVNNAMCLIDVHGNIYETRYEGRNVENIPEPRRRYQTQYEGGYAGTWHEQKYDECNATAWLIETDHGEGSSPRYTYEREEVSK